MAGIIPWIATRRHNLTGRAFAYFAPDVTQTVVAALTSTGTATTGCCRRGPGQQVCFGSSNRSIFIVAVVADGVVIWDRTGTAAIIIAVPLPPIWRCLRGRPVRGHGFRGRCCRHDRWWWLQLLSLRRRRSGGRTGCCFRRGSTPSLQAGRGSRGRWTAAVTPARLSASCTSARSGDGAVAVGNQSARAVAGPRTAAIIIAARRRR